jgi:large subunit ribosomal protein L9
VKVILKEEVGNLGLAGEVVDVADGYGRNYLIPRGLAIKATQGALKEAETLTRARKTREAATIGAAREYQEALESRKLRIPVRVDEGGTLYGSVGPTEIQRTLKERGHEIERIRVHPQVVADVDVEVVDVEGVVTVEGLRQETHQDEETGESLEERALAAAAEVEEVPSGADVQDDEVERAVADAETPAEALAARAAQPTDVDAPTRVEDLVEDDEES